MSTRPAPDGPTLDSLHRLWYRAGRRQSWRAIAQGTALEMSERMWALIADGHPQGDWITLPEGVDANRGPGTARPSGAPVLPIFHSTREDHR